MSTNEEVFKSSETGDQIKNRDTQLYTLFSPIQSTIMYTRDLILLNTIGFYQILCSEISFMTNFTHFKKTEKQETTKKNFKYLEQSIGVGDRISHDAR